MQARTNNYFLNTRKNKNLRKKGSKQEYAEKMYISYLIFLRQLKEQNLAATTWLTKEPIFRGELKEV